MRQRVRATLSRHGGRGRHCLGAAGRSMLGSDRRDQADRRDRTAAHPGSARTLARSGSPSSRPGAWKPASTAASTHRSASSGRPARAQEHATSNAVCGGLWGPAAKTCSPDLGRRLEALGVVEVGLQPAGRLDAGPARRHQTAPPPAPPGPGPPAAWRVPGWAGLPDPGPVGGLEQVVGHLQRAGEQGDARPQERVPAPSGLAHDRRRPVALASPEGVPRPGLGLGRRGARRQVGQRAGPRGPDDLQVGAAPPSSCGARSRGRRPSGPAPRARRRRTRRCAGRRAAPGSSCRRRGRRTRGRTGR